MELESCSWPMCSKQPQLCGTGVVSRLNEFCLQRDRPAVAKFSKFRVWEKVPEGSILISEVPKFPYNTVLDRKRKPLCQKTAHFVQWFGYNTGLWRTDKRTDRQTRTHDDSIYRASTLRANVCRTYCGASSVATNEWSRAGIGLLLVFVLK